MGAFCIFCNGATFVILNMVCVLMFKGLVIADSQIQCLPLM